MGGKIVMSWFDDLSEGQSNLIEVNITEPPRKNKQTNKKTNSKRVSFSTFQLTLLIFCTDNKRGIVIFKTFGIWFKKKKKKKKLLFMHKISVKQSGLQNPREHGSAAPRKKYGWQKKKYKNTFKKNPQKKKRGLRMLILFLDMA